MTVPPPGQLPSSILFGEALYVVDIEEARQAADALGIFDDLDKSAETFDRLRQAMAVQPRDDAILEQALYIAGIVCYARCFMHGKRYQLGEQVFDGRYPLPTGDLGQHQLLMNLATRDLRHPVSGFEQSRVGVYLGNINGEPHVVGTGAVHTRHHIRIPERIDEILAHVRALRDYVQSVAQARQAEVARVTSRMPIAEIVKSGHVILAAPKISMAGDARKGETVVSIPGLD